MTNQAYQPLIAALNAALIENESELTCHQGELFRIFHGRGHIYPALSHLNLDYYGPYLFLLSYDVISTSELTDLAEQIWQQVSLHAPDLIKGLVFQQRAGRETHSQVLFGEDPEKFNVTELGLTYQVELTRSQNTGIFPDMRVGRQWVKDSAQGCKVLNLFSYTCGFSLAAMSGGATQVVNMDMNKGVLRTGKINHQLNGFDNNVSYLPHDILKSFGKLKKLGPFDLIIVDPPSFQKGSFVLTKDYQKILRRLPEVLTEDTQVLLCANSPELSLTDFKVLIAEHVDGKLNFVSRLAAAPNFVEADDNRSLKALVYQATI